MKVRWWSYHAAESSISLPRVAVNDVVGLEDSVALVFLGRPALVANAERRPRRLLSNTLLVLTS